MFYIRNKEIKFPNPYPKIDIRKQATAKTKGQYVIDGYELRSGIDFMPQIGMQEQLCSCEANLVFICGEATSGKTYGMFLKALQGVHLNGFTARLISVRLQDSKKGSSIFRDGVQVCGNFGKCSYNSSDYPTFVWSQWQSNLQLIHSNFNADNPSEWEQFQDYAKKNQASLIMIDEATEIKQFKMFAYWFSRNRDSSGYSPQMILSFNPSHEHWTTEMLKDAGFLREDYYLDKSKIGSIVYFYNKGNTPSEIIWGKTKEEVVRRANLTLRKEDKDAGLSVYDYVKSFTVLSATSADNREIVYATKGGSVANLHATGAEQRSVLGEAYFGELKKEEINVSRQMVHNLWENPINDDETMYATMDISSGATENDNAPMIIWRGLQMVNVEFFNGKPTEIAEWITTILSRYGIDVTHFAYDATGHGYWMQGLTNGIAVTANKRQIQEYDEFSNPIKTDDYFNCRSQLIGKTQVMFEKGEISCAIPKEKVIPRKHKGTSSFINALFDEINIFASSKRQRKIYYKSKDEFKSKFHFSPDIMDAVCLRAVFELDARPKKKPQTMVDDNIYYNLYTSYYNNY